MSEYIERVDMNELRIKFAEPEKKQNQPHVALALKHHRDINMIAGRWARIDIIYEEVLLHQGYILSDGTKECAISTRSYYITTNGEATYTTQVHP